MTTSEARNRFLTPDTTDDAARVQFSVLRRLSPERRWELAFEMTASIRALAAEGVRLRHPDYNEGQIKIAVIRLTLGDDLFRQVYPGVNIAP